MKRSTRLPKGFKGLWDRLTDSYQRIRRKNEAATDQNLARDKPKKELLIYNQLKTKQTLQQNFKKLRHKQRDERPGLFKDVKRHYESLGKQEELKKLLDQERQSQKHSLNNLQKPNFDSEI